MTIQTNYTQARANFAKLLDRVTKDREVVIIERKDQENVAMIDATELVSLMETSYLLRSPANAERLLNALAKALKNEGITRETVDLKHEVGLE